MIRRIQYSNCFIFLVKLDLLSYVVTRVGVQLLFLPQSLFYQIVTSLTFLLSILLVISCFVV